MFGDESDMVREVIEELLYLEKPKSTDEFYLYLSKIKTYLHQLESLNVDINNVFADTIISGGLSKLVKNEL